MQVNISVSFYMQRLKRSCTFKNFIDWKSGSCERCIYLQQLLLLHVFRFYSTLSGRAPIRPPTFDSSILILSDALLAYIVVNKVQSSAHDMYLKKLLELGTSFML